jgi:hypothetical protein
MLGFESVWVVVVPVKVTELFFPARAGRPWLHRRGRIVALVVFLLGSRIAWYGWTQKARPRLNAAPYHPPPDLIALGFIAILALMVCAYLIRNFGMPSPGDYRATAPPWLAGLTSLLMGAAWFDLIGQNFISNPVQPFWLAIFAGLAWAVVAFVLFVWWSSRAAWSEVHQLAAAVGATLACMAMPYMTVAGWPKVDVVGKMFFDSLALFGFFILARKVLARNKHSHALSSES